MTVLQARDRKDLTGQETRNIRLNGFVPGVLYGNKIESQPVSVESVAFLKTMREVGQNGLFDLELENGKKHHVMVQEVQVDPLKNHYTHIDFFEVNMKEKRDANVPVHLEGEAPGASEGGIVNHLLYEITVHCLPADIPESITVDISSLNVGDTLSISEMRSTVSVDIVNEDDEAIVTVQAPTVTEDPDETEEDGTTALGVEATEEREDDDKDRPGRVE
ncbi:MULTISPECIES: 50S ribosomal protein L25/general stress protein Ctc [Shouchella]|uniref:Large ribosomal subunit protein bL25 n=3 Tax=Bacillaceae TaxID=186817 RepID=A0A060M7T4_9BACI|nr:MULTISPECIES: 50S ribosomal protein L25/general stress protein Ctc [Bacillaceae]RQW18093.1 50S ribosomal protein L25/general stress protein Ctc [Bacillus sp. C1-1]AIC96603.1 50S ribosomal protein L25 [Shouchella lehensis G1]KQL51630.1 50S ribosomal protein L25 [Alkalicoccobacillus plakortidis]MBG9782389.1 50S ribosomal protein L25 [Shouchella lehensis]TES46871.1 50S ribosomal protein L25/general stress protein Ctc [Shouchella lehensis]